MGRLLFHACVSSVLLTCIVGGTFLMGFEMGCMVNNDVNYNNMTANSREEFGSCAIRVLQARWPDDVYRLLNNGMWLKQVIYQKILLRAVSMVDCYGIRLYESVLHEASLAIKVIDKMTFRCATGVVDIMHHAATSYASMLSQLKTVNNKMNGERWTLKFFYPFANAVLPILLIVSVMSYSSYIVTASTDNARRR
jgi:hypothetical protein